MDELKAVFCKKCSFTVVQDLMRTRGCGCDPDAPSWIAIERDGRLLKMSGASYELLV